MRTAFEENIRVFQGRDYLDGLKILYVEDEPSIRESLIRFLKRRTAELYVACNGEEGLVLFQRHQPDMIITDIRMTVMDGFDMITHIRSVNQDIPIIITTGYSDEEFYQKAIDLGVDKYIKKPINLKDLMNVIQRGARAITQQRELEAQSQLIRNILDVSQNLMLITDGRDISYINRALLRFSHCRDLEEFNFARSGLESLLVPFDNAFYKNKNFEEWVRYAANSSEANKLIVYMQEPESPEADIFAYLVQINKFPSGHDLLISFSDITNIEKEKLHYKELAQYDELTKIYNRKKFNDELNKEIDRAVRYGHPLSLAMFDIDHFKNINDTYGHLVGDYVLKEVVHVVNNEIRKSDIFCRYGGEEFTLLMTATKLDMAQDTADRIRKVLENHVFGEVGHVTCSIGVSEYKPEDTHESFVKRSDDALYQAKQTGRNKVVAL